MSDERDDPDRLVGLAIALLIFIFLVTAGLYYWAFTSHAGDNGNVTPEQTVERLR